MQLSPVALEESAAWFLSPCAYKVEKLVSRLCLQMDRVVPLRCGGKAGTWGAGDWDGLEGDGEDSMPAMAAEVAS